ncbi:hypothetical protein [Dactylosporangium salmoneum]|uniref:Uncharacterized protein n=1 Tax=Dactylosporangium salmoneum TaxID=53361 RepID=A0ABN3GW51_9ACTN
MRLLLQFGTIVVVSLAGSLAVAAVDGHAWLTLILGVATAIATIAAYRWVVRRVGATLAR